MFPRRLPAALLAALALAATAAGCGDERESVPGATTEAATEGAAPETEAAPGEEGAPAEGSADAATEGDEGAVLPISEDLESKPKIPKPKGEPISTLVAKDIVVGDGAAAKAGDMITVRYVGVSHSSGEQFDASWDNPGNAFPFVLGGGQVIAGWDQGLVGMKVGGRRELVIPPDLAYGDAPPPGIDPGETLVFVVDLKKIGA